VNGVKFTGGIPAEKSEGYTVPDVMKTPDGCCYRIINWSTSIPKQAIEYLQISNPAETDKVMEVFDLS
jgi:hypothetical protein